MARTVVALARGWTLVASLLGSMVLVAPREGRAAAPFVRGDSNGDGAVDVSDALATLGYLFLGGFDLGCLDAADSNDDGALELTDAIYSLGYLFLGGPPPAGPFPGCGEDPTPDDPLDCASSPAEACGGGPPESRVVELLEVLTLRGTEPCCLGGAAYAVRAGDCALLGGTTPPADGGCPAETIAGPGFAWAIAPPPTIVDSGFPVEVLAIGEPDADLLTWDLVALDEEGDELGPVRLAATGAGPTGRALDLPVGGLPPGRYGLRVSAWKLGQPAEGESSIVLDGEEAPLDPPAIDRPVAVLDLPEPFRVAPTSAPTLSPLDVGALVSEAPAMDPLMTALALQMDAAEDALRQVEASLGGPAIDGLRGEIRDAEAERAAAEREAAEAAARARELRDRLAELRRLVDALALVNRWLDVYFGPDDLATLAEQIRRRAAILAGAAADDPAELDEALQKKKDRLAEVDRALADKKAKLEELREEHAALKGSIRAQFHKTRRTQGDNMGHIEIEDGGVAYDIVGLLVVNDGQDVLKYAPHGKAYKEEKAKLDEMIRQYEDLWRRIGECEREIADLEAEKRSLEENIARLENAEGEVAETDAILDGWFRGAVDGTAPHAPHVRDLIARLRALGEDALADLLEGLLSGVPRTPEELEELLARLAALREAKHAREAELGDEAERVEGEAEEEEERAAEAERRAREKEDEIRALEDELRRAEEEARRAAEEEYRRAQAAAEEEARRRRAAAELDRRIRELRDRAREGDEEALQELAQLIGLTLLDEITGDLKLGSVLGGILTVAEMPECACKILKALRGLFGERFDSALILHANEVIREFRECAGLPAIASVEIGAEEMARAVQRLPKGQRREVVAAIDRALRASDCP